MFGVIMPLCNRMFCCIFGWYFYIEIRLKCEIIVLLSSSRAFPLSTPMENSAVCQLQSFFIVYPCGQWGYIEKKLQNATNSVSVSVSFFFCFPNIKGQTVRVYLDTILMTLIITTGDYINVFLTSDLLQIALLKRWY